MFNQLKELPTDLFKMIIDEYKGLEIATSKYNLDEFIIYRENNYNISEFVIDYINKYNVKEIKEFNKDYFSKKTNPIFEDILSYYHHNIECIFGICDKYFLTIEQFIFVFCRMTEIVLQKTDDCLHEDIEEYYGYLYEDPEMVGDIRYAQMEQEYYEKRQYSPDLLEHILRELNI